jgi:putative ABC transport system permease protein
MRAFLTMLGIIIGVGAVTVIVGMGDGMKNYISSSFESMGTNLILVNVMGRGTSRSVDVDDMYALVKQNPDALSYVSPTVSISGTVKIGSEESGSTAVTGVGEDYCAIKRFSLSEGRFIQYIDILRRQKVCDVGSYLAKTYNSGRSVASTLKMNGNTFTIVGVLNEEADSEEGGTDDAVYIPYSVAAKMSWAGQISGYSFSGASEENISEAKSLIENALYKIYESEDFYNVTSMTEILDTMSEMINVVVIVLGAIAAISLLVGGIGIMNIMLVSVTERTREIGIRKSLGAKQRDILQQFVIEAATTSSLGGVLGIGLGFLLSSIATKILVVVTQTELSVSPSPTAVLGAFSVSVAIGILFGYLPARKAAKLNPIDALRYE